MLIQPRPPFMAHHSITPRQQPVAQASPAEQQPASPLQELRQKQLDTMRQTIGQLQQLKKNSAPKKMAAERAAQLKQRLDSLKVLLSKLPPGDYKALVQELKQIAKELAALGKQLGNAGGSHISLPAAMPTSSGHAEMGMGAAETAASADADAPGANTVPAETASAEASMAAATDTAAVAAQAQQAASEADSASSDAAVRPGQEAKLKPDKSPFASPRNDDDQDERTLRSLLSEARKVLKQAIALIKIKHQPDDKESRKLFADIEREIAQLDHALAAQPPASAVSSVEGLAADPGPGSIIDTSA